MSIELSVFIGAAPATRSPLFAESVLRSYFETSLPPAEVSERLGLPRGIPIHYRVKAIDEALSANGVIPIQLSVHGCDLPTSSRIEAELGDLLFDRLKEPLPENTCKNLGLKVGENVTLQLHITDAAPPIVSSAQLAARAGIKPGKELGWSKGCHSWPW